MSDMIERTPARKRLDAWSAENPRDERAMVALAAWLNTTPDKLPKEMRVHTCAATKEAWARVADAIAALPPAPDAVEALVKAAEAEDDDDKYLIVKRGMYYRPNSQGYTSSPAEAGLYTLAQAVFITHPNGPIGPRDGMSFVSAAAIRAGGKP